MNGIDVESNPELINRSDFRFVRLEKTPLANEVNPLYLRSLKMKKNLRANEIQTRNLKLTHV